MSEHDKPHDDHVHDDAHDAPAPEGHAHDDHAHGNAAVEAVTDEAAHHEAPAEAAAEDHHPAADAHGETPATAAHDDHAPVEAHDDHAAHDDAAADHAEPAHVEPAHDDHHAPDVPPVVAAAAVAGAAATAASSSGKPPIWSDAGDAPFEDADTTPVYARKKGGKSKSGGGGSSNETFEIIKTVFFALLIAVVLRIVLFQPFTIPSASMEPNLYEGDYIVVSKWSYGYSKHAIPFSPSIFKGRIMERQPERGDIVVFKLPSDNKTDYIKRVIGLPGDTVQMINNQLYLNGAVIQDVAVKPGEVAEVFGARPAMQMTETLPGGRSYTIQEFGPGYPLDNTEVFTIPAGFYFMVGDNRDNSLDSRERPENGGVGLVPAENLIGKAEIILFSWSPGAALANPISWFSKVRTSRFFTVLR